MTEQILIVGTGGREHAIAEALAKSEQVDVVYVAPGNPGMESTHNKIQTVDIKADDVPELLDFARKKAISITFVGPEVSFVAGIVDEFRDAGLDIVGPTKEAAQLESSKSFAKEVMDRAKVKTAEYKKFFGDELEEAISFIKSFEPPYVIKQDGLAAGKGVVIAESFSEAEAALNKFLSEPQASILVEEFLSGDEFSYFAFVNGEHIIKLTSACDYKRLLDDDKGPNTGGMGAIAPVDWIDEKIEDDLIEEIIQPVASTMVKMGVPYTGVMYLGGMLGDKGAQVIEFNARFGDPETQVILPLMKSDFYEVVQAHLNQKDYKVEWKDKYGLGVVLAADGYPTDPVKGIPLNPLQLTNNIRVHYAGIKDADIDKWESSSGRIAMVSSQAHKLLDSRQVVYDYIDQQIKNEQIIYRNDIGYHRQML